jgi:phage protein D
MADQALFEINVSGTNVSERFNPILESLTVTDKVGTTSDTASIVLSDIGGAIILPQSGDSLTISLGFKSSGIGLVFDGTVDSVRSTGSRGGGRTLSISAKGFDTKGKAKHPLEFHKDDASLQDFMSEAADKAGLSFQADGSLGAVKRPYWVAGNESFIHLGQRIAREVGGNFKIGGVRRPGMQRPLVGHIAMLPAAAISAGPGAVLRHEESEVGRGAGPDRGAGHHVRRDPHAPADARRQRRGEFGVDR